VILYALDTTWELHKPFIQKSALLSAMVRRADKHGLKNISEEDEEPSNIRKYIEEQCPKH